MASQANYRILITPPFTVTQPVTEVLHGVQIVDPYRWLEEQSSQATREWIAEQTAYSQQYFNAIPGRPRLKKRVEELLAVRHYSSPRKVGERCFFLKREAHQEQPVLMMREGESAEEIVLLDPMQMTGSVRTAIRILAISRTGRLLAFSAREDGRDYAPIGVLDVDHRRILDDSLPAGICGGLEFSEDQRGFYYVHRALDSPRPHYHAVLWHKLGTPFEDDSEIFFLSEEPDLHLAIVGAPSSQVFLYRTAVLQDVMRCDYYIHDLQKGGKPRKIVEDISAFFHPFFVGNQLLAFTDFQAPNRRIVAIDLKNPAPANWQTIVPEEKFPLMQFAIAGDLLCLVYLEGLADRGKIFDLTGRKRGELTTPSEGTLQLCWQPAPTDTLFYEFSSFGYPPRIMEYRPFANTRELDPQSLFPHLSTVEIKRVRYPSKDGTLVPMSLVAKKQDHTDRPRPVFLTAYGGFGTSMTPRFTVLGTILMELGCIFAVANVRGGEEFGKEWHDAAKRHKRQTAIDDFLSATEWLLTEHIAEPGRIAIGGGSNAGLLIGAALTQRPDLFRAALCLGPLLDMLRYHKFDLAKYWIDEFGSADIADDFHALYSYSPYHRAQDHIAYPAVMFVSGDADTRCNPMHARKMAARLQAANSSRHPILLDYKPTWGHVPVQPLSARMDALTDRLLFLCHELDLNIPED